jgi:hypothetical protein
MSPQARKGLVSNLEFSIYNPHDIEQLPETILTIPLIQALMELQRGKEEMGETKSPTGMGKGKTSGKKVIVDTNALLIPGEFRVDIFDELARLGYLDIIVPKVVLKELDRLRQSPGLKGKDKIAANVGYLLLRMYTDTPMQRAGGILRCRISIEEGEEEEEQGDTDEILAALAVKRKAAVLTNDETLRTKLSRAGVRTVYLRGRNRLEESE